MPQCNRLFDGQEPFAHPARYQDIRGSLSEFFRGSHRCKSPTVLRRKGDRCRAYPRGGTGNENFLFMGDHSPPATVATMP